MKLERFEPQNVFTVKENILRQGLEISHMLTVSISHISQETAEDMMLDGIANRFKIPVYTKMLLMTMERDMGFMYIWMDNA